MSDCLDKEERKAERQALTDNRDQGMDKECEQRVEAKEIDGDEAKRLEETIIKTSEEKAELERYKLKQKYGQVSFEIAKADMVGLHPKLKLHYHLTMGREFVEAKDTAKVKTLLKNNEGAAFIPDVNRVTKINKVKTLEVLNVLGLVDMEREFVATDEDLVKRALFAIHNTEEIKTLLGISICQPTANPKTGEITIPSIKVARQLLNLIGYDLKRTKRRIIDCKQEYIYKVVDLLPPQTRSEIFNYWQTKDRDSSMVSSESIEKAQENQIVRQTVYDKSTSRTDEKGQTNVVPPTTPSASEQIVRQTVYSKSTPRPTETGSNHPHSQQSPTEDGFREVARQTVYSKSTSCADETTPLRVGTLIISQATMKIGRIVSVSQKLSEVLVEFVDQVSRYHLSSFWDEVELIF
ncbi:MAG: hypothetical protein HRT59_14015 [Crocosphaera sp.]|nr:hypothetical protein [Crocosphaera sp.]